MLIEFVAPARNGELPEQLKARKATAFAMGCVPRISRAQKPETRCSVFDAEHRGIASGVSTMLGAVAFRRHSPLVPCRSRRKPSAASRSGPSP